MADCDSVHRARTGEGIRIQRRDDGGNIQGEASAAAGSEACGAGTTRTPVGANCKQVAPG